MKFIISLTVITVLAALAVAGCHQSLQTSSTDTPATNANPGGATSSYTNILATNSLPDVHTNMASNDP